ncbi:hypothetical protein E2C01_022612 [Portunus trituberculatus]|uniref:Uncharacterized protein n=1 Tax=Portunus trituberculatus TaxID=210409 RepID=A0A5B7E8D6_PORTR|nr:hypothetical protein [Portunus trituberculatus]
MKPVLHQAWMQGEQYDEVAEEAKAGQLTVTREAGVMGVTGARGGGQWAAEITLKKEIEGKEFVVVLSF